MNDRFVLQGNLTILDQETGLLWQRAASADRMVWKDGFGYVDELNRSEFADHGDWRYPSKDEMKTLILPQENRSSGLYISSLFGSQRNCWTSSHGDHRAVYADFYYGDIYWVEENYANYFIRAVRNK